ncbi:hypothetical protein RRF57_005163 [Xylaria bambusicola]|uniref:Uncharacterized protein n=1 Tax=Xylaria bambusicola TaxID=326684 RepID=A0AAN7ULH6_9PEZI
MVRFIRGFRHHFFRRNTTADLQDELFIDEDPAEEVLDPSVDARFRFVSHFLPFPPGELAEFVFGVSHVDLVVE